MKCAKETIERVTHAGRHQDRQRHSLLSTASQACVACIACCRVSCKCSEQRYSDSVTFHCTLDISCTLDLHWLSLSMSAAAAACGSCVSQPCSCIISSTCDSTLFPFLFSRVLSQLQDSDSSIQQRTAALHFLYRHLYTAVTQHDNTQHNATSSSLASDSSNNSSDVTVSGCPSCQLSLPYIQQCYSDARSVLLQRFADSSEKCKQLAIKLVNK